MPGFWEDQQAAAKTQKEKSIIEKTLSVFQGVEEKMEEFELLLEYQEQDPSVSPQDVLDAFTELKKALDKAQEQALLSDQADSNNAIVSINAGAGGTESCDWAAMLSRMIQRWAESKQFTLKVLDEQKGESAGIKSTVFIVEGAFAYGLLKSENGIHRLVRISPFDSNARRHTSFASVFATPEIDDDIEIEVEDKDLKVDVYRSGGAGGQSVNTTDSAVRMTHLPTGIVVTCQNERSQLQNKATALKILKSRLYDLALEEKKAKLNEVEESKKEIGWGSQIRSYVLHPYKMVKDHRTQFESSQAEKVLDGDLDAFMHAYLQQNALDGTHGPDEKFST